jgi:AcrR family transcriptional regulator
MSFPAALPGRRERQLDSMRARLFQAALSEFQRVGFARASVSRIARAAGASRASFYFHFPTKEHVLLELEWIEERRVVERLEPAGSLRDAFHALAEGILELHARLGDGELVRDMFSIYVRRPTELRIDEQRYPIGRAFTRLFREAAARGELRAGLEPDAAARVFLVSVMGMQTGPPTTRERLRADFELLFSLYLEDESREAWRGGSMPRAS